MKDWGTTSFWKWPDMLSRLHTSKANAYSLTQRLLFWIQQYYLFCAQICPGRGPLSLIWKLSFVWLNKWLVTTVCSVWPQLYLKCLVCLCAWGGSLSRKHLLNRLFAHCHFWQWYRQSSRQSSPFLFAFWFRERAQTSHPCFWPLLLIIASWQGRHIRRK